MWKGLECVIESEVSQKEKNKYILTCVCGIQKNGTDEPISKAGIQMQMQRTGLWARKQGGQEGETNLESSTDIIEYHV